MILVKKIIIDKYIFYYKFKGALLFFLNNINKTKHSELKFETIKMKMTYQTKQSIT